MERAVREESGLYNAPVTKPIGPFYAWMERLDRWGYITVGLSLLVVSMGIFGHGWFMFARSANGSSFLLSAVTLVNNLLLVVILLELFRTIVRFLETDILRVEPYLAVGHYRLRKTDADRQCGTRRSPGCQGRVLRELPERCRVEYSHYHYSHRRSLHTEGTSCPVRSARL